MRSFLDSYTAHNKPKTPPAQSGSFTLASNQKLAVFNHSPSEQPTSRGHSSRNSKHRPPVQTEDPLMQNLQDLQSAAKLERLECALPLIKILQSVMATEQRNHGPHRGKLTVRSWISLLNRWELQLESANKRQVFYAQSFFKDILGVYEEKTSPLAPLMTELLALMENSLAVEVN